VPQNGNSLRPNEIGKLPFFGCPYSALKIRPETPFGYLAPIFEPKRVLDSRALDPKLLLLLFVLTLSKPLLLSQQRSNGQLFNSLLGPFMAQGAADL
jgi:hypothetical protein